MNVTLDALGSSPRMRGAHLVSAIGRDGEGIIPAYAGSTNALCMRPLNHRDHPRVCGEHWCIVIHEFDGEGSSPRMRGAPRR